MKWFNKLLSIFLSLLFFGCASYRPVIDTKGVDMSAYEQDLAECQTYAREVKPGLQAVAVLQSGLVWVLQYQPQQVHDLIVEQLLVLVLWLGRHLEVLRERVPKKTLSKTVFVEEVITF